MSEELRQNIKNIINSIELIEEPSGDLDPIVEAKLEVKTMCQYKKNDYQHKRYIHNLLKVNIHYLLFKEIQNELRDIINIAHHCGDYELINKLYSLNDSLIFPEIQEGE